MSNIGIGCGVGMVIVGVTCSGIGLFLASVTGIAWLGSSIGEHSGLVTAYVVVGFIAGYVVSGIALLVSLGVCLASPKDGAAGIFGVIIYTVAISVILAFPSSFISQSACHAGNQRSVWVMRVIPVLGLTELALANDNDHLACVNNHLVGG